MSIRDRLSARQNTAAVTQDIPDFGPVCVRRITTAEAMAISKSKESSLEMVQKSLVDEVGNPVFPTLESLKAVDWPLIKQFMDACAKVNSVQEAVDGAAKN